MDSPNFHIDHCDIDSTGNNPSNVSVGCWTPCEDERLRAAVRKHGTKWNIIAGEVESRNGEQCAKRWKNALNPDLDHSPWTEEEVSCPVEPGLFRVSGAKI